jgi:hypothetical protein
MKETAPIAAHALRFGAKDLRGFSALTSRDACSPYDPAFRNGG